MHKRFSALIDKAQELSYKEYEKRLTGYSREDLFNQIFAELIVRECVEVCNSIAKDRAGCHDSEGRDTAYSCGDEIKDHFGVE